MSVAKTIEITATSPTSFDDAVKQGIAKAAQSLQGIQGAWVNEQTVKVEDNQIKEYRVNLKVTFLLK